MARNNSGRREGLFNLTAFHPLWEAVRAGNQSRSLEAATEKGAREKCFLLQHISLNPPKTIWGGSAKTSVGWDFLKLRPVLSRVLKTPPSCFLVSSGCPPNVPSSACFPPYTWNTPLTMWQHPSDKLRDLQGTRGYKLNIFCEAHWCPQLWGRLVWVMAFA